MSPVTRPALAPVPSTAVATGAWPPAGGAATPIAASDSNSGFQISFVDSASATSGISVVVTGQHDPAAAPPEATDLADGLGQLVTFINGTLPFKDQVSAAVNDSANPTGLVLTSLTGQPIPSSFTTSTIIAGATTAPPKGWTPAHRSGTSGVAALPPARHSPTVAMVLPPPDTEATPGLPALDDDAWDDLLNYIEEKRVIPIVGPELLRVETDAGPRLLYDWLAEKLAAIKPGADGKLPLVTLRADRALDYGRVIAVMGVFVMGVEGGCHGGISYFDATRVASFSSAANLVLASASQAANASGVCTL